MTDASLRPLSAPSARYAGLGAAARHAGVMWSGLFALGIGFGVLVTDHGLPWWLAPLLSGVVFAGSLEFLLIGMIATVVPLGAIATTTLLVNARHLFYGLSFPLERVDGRWRRAYSVYALCDEAFALLSARTAGLTAGRMLWTQAGFHLSWTLGALSGAIAGSTLLAGAEGLDFVLTALFLVLAVDAYRAEPDPTTLLVALGAGVLAAIVTPGSLLLVGMAGFVVVMAARHLGRRRA